MSNTIYAFVLSTLAGFSTLIGFLPILFKLKDIILCLKSVLTSYNINANENLQVLCRSIDF